MFNLVFGKLDYFENNLDKFNTLKSPNVSHNSLIEYKEIDEPCVSLTIIGENRLTDAEVFIRRGAKFSFKAFFSTLVLTFVNLFI